MREFLANKNHRLVIITLSLLFLLGGMSLSAKELPAYYKATTTVNIRESANPESSKVSVVNKGCSVFVSRMKTGADYRQWGYCTDEHSNQGWVCMDYLRYIGKSPSKSSGREKTTQWQKILLHTAHFFGYEHEMVWWFYGCMLVVAIALFFALNRDFDSPYITLLCHAIAIVAAAWYFTHSNCDILWHVTWESVRWWSLVGLWIYIFAARTFLEFVKSLAQLGMEEIRDHTLYAICCWVCSLGWVYVLIWFVANFIVEHTGWALLMLLAAIPKSKIPTIYVKGEGYVRGHGYDGGGKFHGDNGYDYYYDGKHWHPM
ncbi:MAG: hypothetical protein MJZ75_02880 [Paludibacteraceae bacterium]|nr:hypothetical protein [Paludibacteraceae bacterium]